MAVKSKVRMSERCDSTARARAFRTYPRPRPRTRSATNLASSSSSTARPAPAGSGAASCLWEVMRREGSTVYVAKDGKERALPLERAQDFHVYRRETMSASGC